MGAIESSSQISHLKELSERAIQEVGIIREERKRLAKEDPEGHPYEEIFVTEDRRNNPSRISVLDVKKPYAVMDDISYRISKGVDLSARTKHLEREAQAGSSIMNIGMVPDETKA